MSVIAYRDGVMAADSRAFSGRGNPPIGSKWKIRKLKDNTLIGCVTPIPGAGEAVMSWYEAGADPDDGPDVDSFALLVVKPNGEAFYAYDSFFISGPLEADFFAIGSGGSYALGAMKMGADAKTAVGIAADCDEFTGRPIRTLSHRVKKAKLKTAEE